jgi:hypothetical protein
MALAVVAGYLGILWHNFGGSKSLAVLGLVAFVFTLCELLYQRKMPACGYYLMVGALHVLATVLALPLAIAMYHVYSFLCWLWRLATG